VPGRHAGRGEAADDLRGRLADRRLAGDRPERDVLLRRLEHARDSDQKRRAGRRPRVGEHDDPAALHAEGLADKPVNFTRNKLVVIVPKSNPAAIDDIYDLTRQGVSIAIGNSAVPVGAYTLTILKNMGLTGRILPNIVSEEVDVRTVLTKVVLGQADAGFVFATDARTSSRAGPIAPRRGRSWPGS
jgi:hypothetical protein